MAPLRRLMAVIVLILSISLPVRAAEAFRTGDQILICDPKNSVALSSQKTDNFNRAIPVTFSDGTPAGYTETEVWTLEKQDDGSFRILQNGQALSLGESYSHLRMDDVYPFWTLEETEGGWYLKNTGRNLYLYPDARRGYWIASAAPTVLTLPILSRAEAPEMPDAQGFRCYFGQLHSHTNFSDGILSPEDAYEGAKAAGLDFFAVTDHSQSFDNADFGELNADATSVSTEWALGKEAARAATTQDFLGIFGFEMTWNQGQGHMITFGTPGFLSRDREEYQPYATGMENYYAALLETKNSVSMFCHPGETYGDFKDFKQPAPALEEKITLVETDFTGDAYDICLARGWYAAPSAAGDHHGEAGTSAARTVILAETLTEASFLDALACRRVYATEDPDLEILFFLNEQIMGSRLSWQDIGETVTITASLSDPTDAALGTLEVIGPAGESLASAELSGSQCRVRMTMNANRAFYYLRLTQPDGDVALTAPVWLEDAGDFGIASLTACESVTRAGKVQTFALELYNNERGPMQVHSITLQAGDAIYTDTTLTEVPAYGRKTCTFTHTFPADGVGTVTATVSAACLGQTREFTESLRVPVLPALLAEDVVLDLTHGNETSFHTLDAMAASRDIRIHRNTAPVTEELLESCRLLLIPTPTKDFSAEYVRLVKNYLSRGGSLVLCGTAHSQDESIAARCNALLNGIGSTMAFSADDARDPLVNRGDPAQLYTSVFSEESWLAEIAPGQVYGQEFGCSLSPGSGSWLVKAEPSGNGTVLLAAEQLPGGGSVFIAGDTFFTDPYLEDSTLANGTILANILGILRQNQVLTPIDALRRSEAGRMYLVEGLVTAGTANPSTTFPNSIYLQDETGGIAARGYSDHGLPQGAKVRILGCLTETEGNPLLEILRLERLETLAPPRPEDAFCAVDYGQRGGHLLALEGKVTAVTVRGDGVSRFTLEDVHGDTLDVLIEPYILSGSLARNELARTVTPGVQIRAVGFLHLSEGETVLRIRDCDEVTPILPEDADTNPDTGDGIGLYLMLLFLMPPLLIFVKKRCPR